MLVAGCDLLGCPKARSAAIGSRRVRLSKKAGQNLDDVRCDPASFLQERNPVKTSWM